ncbi:hypothetical protein [Oceanobacillus sojae]|uniref:hypothetical protein n=1 Tax=Oceanobacillus sojae TaxID=582851 RepID=UPI00098860FA|nr:hypothetical protein [Oceanobacillus sojae]MCT1902708.1 hypothetical protein [Oceanobacillus sojae]
MKKSNMIILGSFILAVVLGIFGQDFAYFLNGIFPGSYPIYNLTILTLISIILFLNSLVMICFQYKKQRMNKEKLGIYIALFVIAGLLTSWWSLFVLIMWWS